MFGLWKTAVPKKKTARKTRRPMAGFENLEGRDLMAVDGNDSTSGAIVMGSFSGAAAAITKTGNVGSVGDNQDYYKFTLSSSNLARVSLSGLSSDLDVDIRTSSGSVITSGTHGSTTSESIGAICSSGTFYIRVFKGASTAVSNYTLTLTLGDDSRTAALDVGAYSGSAGSYSRSSNISGSDTQDFYKFSLSAANHVVVNLTGLSADLDLQLQSSTGSVLGSSVKNGSSSESLNFVLNSGTYYVRVYQGTSGASSNYSLGLSFGDDSFTAAAGFGTLSTTAKSFSGNINTTDTRDYFSFNVSTLSSVQLQLTGLSQDLDFELYTSSGSKIGSGTKGGTASELLTLNLSAGTYYVKVIPGVTSASSNYTLTARG